jgi:nitroimidazol reductase NimA-like FMN-containing flavoprotein (pyridoxamine 5'-phosphate oxidase superfamily)
MTAIDPPSLAPRTLVPMPEAEALGLLSTVPFGRIVFTDRALPAIRPVNHIVYQGDIVIQSQAGSALARAAENGVVVAFEADDIDAERHLGWSVVVTGIARRVDDPEEARLLERLVTPWIQMPQKSHPVRIHADLVTGFRLTGQ